VYGGGGGGAEVCFVFSWARTLQFVGFFVGGGGGATFWGAVWLGVVWLSLGVWFLGWVFWLCGVVFGYVGVTLLGGGRLFSFWGGPVMVVGLFGVCFCFGGNHGGGGHGQFGVGVGVCFGWVCWVLEGGWGVGCGGGLTGWWYFGSEFGFSWSTFVMGVGGGLVSFFRGGVLFGVRGVWVGWFWWWGLCLFRPSGPLFIELGGVFWGGVWFLRKISGCGGLWGVFGRSWWCV